MQVTLTVRNKTKCTLSISIVQKTPHLHSYPCFNQATTKQECMVIIFSHVLINQLLEHCFISVSEPYLRLLWCQIYVWHPYILTHHQNS